LSELRGWVRVSPYSTGDATLEVSCLDEACVAGGRSPMSDKVTREVIGFLAVVASMVFVGLEIGVTFSGPLSSLDGGITVGP